MQISNEQINALARPLIAMVDSMSDFFKDPQNEQAYRDWYCKKYGHYPKGEAKV